MTKASSDAYTVVLFSTTLFASVSDSDATASYGLANYHRKPHACAGHRESDADASCQHG